MKIGDWTPAELAAFIQGQVLIDPSSFPPALSMRNFKSGQMQLTESLDFAQGSQLQQDGNPFPPLSVVGAGLNGEAEPMYAEQVGTALWRGGGGTILAQNFDIADASDTISLTNQRIWGNTVYLPTRAPVSRIHWYQIAIPSAVTGQNSSAALFRLRDTVWSDTPVLEEITGISSVGFGSTGSTGLREADFDTPQILDAGVYVPAFRFSWSTITGSADLAGANLVQVGAASSLLGGPPRALMTTTAGSIPSTWVPDRASNARIWVGLS